MPVSCRRSDRADPAGRARSDAGSSELLPSDDADRKVAAMTRLDTDAVHLGREDLAALGVHVPPLDLSTTYPLPSVEAGGAAYETLATGGRPGAGDSLVYQRLWNPNVDRFERARRRARAAAEAPWPSAPAWRRSPPRLLATVAAGRPHVVAVRPLYGGTDHVLASGLLGTRVDVGARRTGSPRRSARTPGWSWWRRRPTPPSTWSTSPRSSPQAGEVPGPGRQHLRHPGAAAARATTGAALVLHSATKFIGGHGDVMGGVVAADEDWLVRLRQVRALTGGAAPPAGRLRAAPRPADPAGAGPRPAGGRRRAGRPARRARPASPRCTTPASRSATRSAWSARQMAGPGALLAFELARRVRRRRGHRAAVPADHPRRLPRRRRHARSSTPPA